MNSFFKSIILAILKIESHLILKKYCPEIISVTGSVGKTSAKEAIFSVLSRDPKPGPSRHRSGETGRVGKSEDSFNSEIGLPLTIIGHRNPWYSVFGWISVILRGLVLVVKTDPFYPEVLVLECSADKPGDIENITKVIKPSIAVVTAIGEIPAHVEFFAGPENIADEKAKILKPLGVTDLAVLNFDDETVLEMKEKTKSKIITFGFGEGADVRATDYNLLYRKEGSNNVPEGITFKVVHNGSSVPFKLIGAFGKNPVYAVLAAVCVALEKGMNLIDASSAVSTFRPLVGRLRLIEGEKKTGIIDDTYNSSPQALRRALELLEEIPDYINEDGTRGRKISVLGDMLELGEYAIQSHRSFGRDAANISDILLTVGPRAKFMADEALKRGMKKTNVYTFSDSYEAGRQLEEIIGEGDLILVKGSQAMRMERVVEEIMAHPEKKSELLARQSPEWLNKP